MNRVITKKHIISINKVWEDIKSISPDKLAELLFVAYNRRFYESVKKAAEYASKCIRYCEEEEVPVHWGLCFEMFLDELTGA